MQSTDLSDYGWCRENDHLQVVWDASDNVQQVQRTVGFLTQGCRCKTGCMTRRCKCRRAQCGPSCHCVNCTNIPTYVTQHADTEQELQEELQEDISNTMTKQTQKFLRMKVKVVMKRLDWMH